MLTIIVPAAELWDERTETFINSSAFTLELEHSLVSLSKWEQIHEKPFLGNEKTTAETYSYFKCMCKTPNVPEEVFTRFTEEHLKQINDYISAKMTATWFNEISERGGSREVITSELIYYWLVSYQIPFEVQDWHLNRLFTLVRVCSIKNQPDKKMSRRESAQQQKTLNDQRRAAARKSG